MTAIVVDINGASELLSVHPNVLRQWEARGEMPRAVTLNGQQRWLVRDLRRWVESQREMAGAN